jgi:hypothetical protein
MKMFAATRYSSQATAWNRPDVEDVPADGQTYEGGNGPAKNFLTVEHRDSWSPSWNNSSSYSASAGNYDFFLA